MDFVARAKTLLVGKARVGALVVLPLAAAVHQAQASILSLPTGTVTCQYDINGSGGGTCSASAQQLSPYNGVAGVSFQLNTPGNSLDLGVGPATLTLTASGILTGPGGGVLNAGTVFNEGYSLSITNVTSDNYLAFSLYDVTTSTSLFSAQAANGSFSGSGLFSGSFTDTLLASATVGDTLQLSLSLYVSGGDMVATLPGDALSMGGPPVSAGAAPEPSTMGLGAFGLAAAAFWRRMREGWKSGPQ